MATALSDDWLNSNSYSGAGLTKPAPVVISKTNNLLSSVYCDMTNYPGVVQDYTVTYNYEAYFTGAIDSASLAADVKNMNSKLVGYLASTAGLCDTLQCTPNSVSCVAQVTTSKANKVIMGATKNTTDVIRTQCKLLAVFLQYALHTHKSLIPIIFNIIILVDLCENNKPTNQLPVFDRTVCIPISASITVSLAKNLTQSDVQTAVTNAIQTGMATGNLNTPNQIVGLVYAPKASTTINTSGSVRKQMRPLGIGLLTAGLIVLVTMIVSVVVCHCRKRNNDKDYEEEEDDDLSLEKDKDDEESNVLTVSYMSDDSTPVKGAKKK